MRRAPSGLANTRGCTQRPSVGRAEALSFVVAVGVEGTSVASTGIVGFPRLELNVTSLRPDGFPDGGEVTGR